MQFVGLGHVGNDYITCRGLRLTRVRRNKRLQKNIESATSEDAMADSKDSLLFPTNIEDE